MTPSFILFRSTPSNVADFPALCSSLQSLESAFVLISFYRFPHALTLCGSAIESVLKSGLSIPPEDKVRFGPLVEKARSRSPKICDFNHEALARFRDLRNRFIHYGFSPNDDASAVSALLTTGFPFLDLCYTEYCNFSFENGLFDKHYWHLTRAKELLDRVQELPDVEPSFCLNGVGYLVKWFLEEVPGWMDDNSEAKWEHSFDAKESLERAWDPCWSFDCPICGSAGTFVCAFDDNSFEEGTLVINKGICVECDLRVPESWRYLADTMCREQVAAERPRILKEYGIHL